jgi:TolB-like protein/class 3 adenylate cyclase/Flp pilus assembly protein TadD
MSAELENEAQLEIGHVLFIDTVAFSKLMVDEQSAVTQRLNQIVRESAQFCADEATDKLIRLPTGDGMVIVFFSSPEAPARCAMEIAGALKDAPFAVRMGIHSGPVHKVRDVDGRANLAGTGVNLAQRVMDCGDAGHILLSRRVAEDLEQHSKWRPRLHHLGQFEIKHGDKIDIVSLHDADVGNPALPEKLKGKKVSRRLFPKAAVAALLLVAVAIAAISFFKRRGAETSNGLSLATIFPGKSIAVLPFKPLVASSRDEILEAGMADTLITKLSNSREIIVPSLSSVRKYDDQKHDPVTMGRELHVNSVLEGNVQKSGDRIRVTARLIKTVDGSSLWADTFDEKFTDVFAVQDAIAQRVAAALQLKLSEEDQQRLTRRYTQNTEAYQLYLKGRFHWNKYTEEDFKKAIDFYNQALQKDPNYALAYAGLASSYIQLGTDFNSAKESSPKAKAYAEKALALDDALAEAHCALGTYYLFFERVLAPAETEFKRAIELNPSYPDVHHYYCHWFESQARVDEGIPLMKRGLELDPLSLLIGEELGWAEYHGHHYDEAAAQIKKTIELDPGFLINYLTLAQIYEQMGRNNEAVAELRKVLAMPGGDWGESLAELGCALAKSGDTEAAKKIIQQLQERSAREYISPYVIATIYADLGDEDKTLEWLEKAIPERSTWLAFIKVEPKFDRFRSDPRFAAFVERTAPH